MSDTSVPVSADAFATAMRAFDLPSRKIAVAVSGGGDSLALTLLMHQWAQQNGGEALALTVDHGLRAAAALEAQQLHDVLTARGIKHEILVWEGDKPVSHIQERARDARYELLIDACQRRGFPALALAHNAEDQIETFWMRLAHGSGVDGLAAMAPVREQNGVTFIRPLLSFTRAQLRETCTQFSAPWIDDPSNADEKFLRVKLRGFESLLAAEGLTPQRLAQTLQKMEGARDALVWATEQAYAACVTTKDDVMINRAQWLSYPADIRRRVMARALQTAVPQKYPAGFEALDNLCHAIASPDFAGRTLGGCIISAEKGGFVYIRPERGQNG